jgi:hypothetical protein
MQVVAVANVKDEIDIIEAFVRHNLARVNRLVVLDNGSSDGTLAVLRKLEAEGLPLDIVEDPSLGMYQGQRTNRLIREWAVGRHGADWVLPLDVDEFVAFPGGGSLVPPGAGDDRPIALPWRSYVARPTDDPSEMNPVVRIRHRLAKESCTWVKVLIPGALAARPDAAVVQGNNELLLGDRGCAAAPSPGAYLAHFPMRSPGQYSAKIAINFLQYAVIPDRAIDAGWHYRAAYELLRRDPAAFRASFHEAAPLYASLPGQLPPAEFVHDPLDYRGGPLRHTPPVNDEARGLLAVLGCAEQLARRQAALSAWLGEDRLPSVERLASVLANIHTHFAEQYYLALGNHTQLLQVAQELRRVQQLLPQQVRQAERSTVRALKQSWTWKTGRLVVGLLRPFRVLARLGRRALSGLPSPAAAPRSR